MKIVRRRLIRRTRPLPSVIVIDPPWGFSDKLPGPGRGAEKHYSTLSPDGIVAACSEMFKGGGAADATLLCWRVASMQEEAFSVIRGLGFTVKSEVVWLKRTKTGKRHFGMGRQVRMEHEVCLIATRGKGATVKDKAVRSTFFHYEPGVEFSGEHVWPYDLEISSVVFSAEATRKHSEKPDGFFDLVEKLYAGPYLELFARRHRPGWDCRGLEVDG